MSQVKTSRSLSFALLAAVVAPACSGFTPRSDVSSADVVLAEGAPADTGGKLAAGECCAKSLDCLSEHCVQLGDGPFYCAKSCEPGADDCPVGQSCAGLLCTPPSSTYVCGPQVAKATVQPRGGCCAKASDCTSGECVATGDGQYFCTVTCTRQPDTCPAGYVCSTADLCGMPNDSTCTYH